MRDEIKQIIESVVRERLAGSEILEVRIAEDEDYQGDHIVRVMVVFDASKGKLDSQKINGLARHLRSRLDSTDAFLHPVFRFVSQADAKRLNAAAA